METILYTKGKDFVVKTVYIQEYKRYATVYEYPNGYMTVVESYTSVLNMIKTHDFWCKFSGIIEGTLTSQEIEFHLTKAFSEESAKVKIA